jgi:hypothetical protein
MKKALVSSTLIITIILILSFAVTAYAVGKVVGVIPKTIDAETCRSSVNARDLANKAWLPGQVAVSQDKIPLLCKTQNKCLTMGGKCSAGYEKIPVISDEEIKKEIANSMYDCWSMLGEGKKDFLGSWQSGFFGRLHCVICSEIEFDDKIKSKFQTIDGLYQYMYENPIPGKDMTYMQYLSNNPNVLIDKSVKDSIPTSQKYDITFYVGRYTLFKDFIIHMSAGAGTGAVAGGIVGSVIPFAGTGVGMVVGGIGGAIGGAIEAMFYQKGEDKSLTSVLLTPVTPEALAVCQSIESIP